MPSSNRVLAVGAAVAAGLMIAGGAAAATAATSKTPAATGYGAPQGVPGYGAPGDGRGPGGHQHTDVTGDEATKVTTAVHAKDSSIAVTRVMKDADGSYDVVGTKGSDRVMAEVSKDLKTVEIRTGGPGGHEGRGHGMRGTEASTAEAAKVSAAIKAKDSSITVEHVMKAPDGSFHAMGTKGSDRVMVEVSKDLKTVEIRTGGPGGMHGHHGWGREGNQPGQQPTPGASGAASPAGYAV